jgi:membrane protease YdiL (CAAX protease family)
MRLNAFQAYRVLTRMAIRRRINRFTRGRKKREDPFTRQATAPRKQKGTGILLIFSIFMLLNSGLLAGQFFNRLSRALDEKEKNIRIDAAGEALDPGRWEMKSPEEAMESDEERSFSFRDLLKGPEARKSSAVAIIGLVFLLLGLNCIFATLGSGNQDLGQVEWSLQWLFTFPVPAKALLLSKMTEYTIGNFFGWFVFFPALCLLFISADYGLFSPFMALGINLYFHLIIASIQLLAETWMRKRFSRARLKNFQALFTIVSTLSFFTLFALALAEEGVDLLLDHGQAAATILAWSPLNVPARIALGGTGALIALLIMAVFGIGLAGAALMGTGRLLKGGLLTETGPYQGARVRYAGKVVRQGWFSGVVAKDLKLLIRDRNLMVQTLIVPVVIIGFQIFVNPELMKAFKTDLHHATAIAFGLGAYVLVFSAVHVLTVEGKTAWLLFTFPRSLDKILLRKALFWGVFSSIMPVILMAWSFTGLEEVGVQGVVNAVLVVVGLVIYAMIGAGIGALGTNLLEQEVKRKVRPAMIYLYMFLSALYSYALYATSFWNKAVMIVLCLLLSYAIWQKVRDHAPYILDPSESPPPRLSLSDGLITLMIFFVLQGILQAVFLHNEVLPSGASLLIAFTIAGLAAFLVSRLNFAVRGVDNVAVAVGFEADRHVPDHFLVRSLMEGIVFGLLAFGAGAAYLWGIGHVEFLKALKETMPHFDQVDPGNLWWFAGLAVLAAPFFEEYLFRGLIYRGLRRTMGVPLAVAASAALFAAVHPPISMVPVFIAGIFMALCMERNRILLAPMIVHAVYNAGMLWVGF